jgi:glycerol-3-phosphate dehydrogenase
LPFFCWNLFRYAVLFVVPTKAIRSVAQEVAQHLKTKPIIIHASKGLEQGTHKRISEYTASAKFSLAAVMVVMS